MQVKMFIHHTLDLIEKEINQWLTEQNIAVCHITQSQCERQGRFLFVISVFYRQPGN
jgi:hypothetical protein